MLICCTIELQHPVISLLIGVIRSPLTPKRRLFVLSSNFFIFLETFFQFTCSKFSLLVLFSFAFFTPGTLQFNAKI